jgi:hypothetical protein
MGMLFSFVFGSAYTVCKSTKIVLGGKGFWAFFQENKSYLENTAQMFRPIMIFCLPLQANFFSFIRSAL